MYENSILVTLELNVMFRCREMKSAMTARKDEPGGYRFGLMVACRARQHQQLALGEFKDGDE